MANFSILAKIGVDSKAFQTGMDKAQNRVNKFRKGVGGLGTALAGLGLSKLANDAIQLGSKISDMAVQMNIGAEALQVLEFGAREAGVATSVMERALRNVQLRTEEATLGNKSYAEAFDILGISVEEFRKLPTEKKLEAIAKAQAEATDKQAAFNAVARILGQRAGPAMQEVLNDLATNGYTNLAKAAKESGTVMSNETIAKMDEAADKIEQFKRRITVLTGTILGYAIPAFDILKNGLGFIGETVGVTILNFKAFFQMLSSTLATVLEPAITGFKALSKGIEAAAQAAAGNFAEAKEAIGESGEFGKKAFTDLTDIPDEIAENFKTMTEDVKFNINSLGDDLDDRANAIKDAWKSAFDEIEEGAKKTSDAVGNIPDEVSLDTGESNIKTKPSKVTGGSKEAGMSSLAAVAGGGRIGSLVSIDWKQLEQTKEQTMILKKIEKNTANSKVSKFK